jgi:hypothetical protein
MNIRTLMTTSLVTLLLVGGAQAKESDNYLKLQTAEQAVATAPVAKVVAAAASDNSSNRWIRRESDRD